MSDDSTASNVKRNHPVLVRFLTIQFLAACLCACGGGGNSAGPDPSGNTPTGPETEYVPDLRKARLLSDTELKTPPIESASGLSAPTPEEQTWLAENHRPIRSIIYAGDFSDLDFLAEELQGKRIVQLGESSHGSSEFSAVKVRVIKYLHERLGYNVIAFESSLAGCHIHDQDLDVHVPKRGAGMECVFGVWDTDDLSDLARYVYSTRQTAAPLRLAGFDIQTSSNFDSTDRVLAWISPVLDRFSQDLTNPAREAITTTASDMRVLSACKNNHHSRCGEFDRQSASHYQRLDEISAQLHTLADTIPSESPDREEVVFAWLAIDSLAGRLRYTRMSVDDDYSIRDLLMAENITRLAELAYPVEKLIIWAHNAHINNRSSYASYPPMGSYLQTHWGDELSTIGLFMLRGVSAYNDRSQAVVKSPRSGSLEAYAYSLRLGALYLRVPRIDAPGTGDDWLHRPIPYYFWGTDKETGVMGERYDGLIVIDRSTMPHYNY